MTAHQVHALNILHSFLNTLNPPLSLHQKSRSLCVHALKTLNTPSSPITRQEINNYLLQHHLLAVC